MKVADQDERSIANVLTLSQLDQMSICQATCNIYSNVDQHITASRQEVFKYRKRIRGNMAFHQNIIAGILSLFSSQEHVSTHPQSSARKEELKKHLLANLTL